jgi:hypothetical protein
MSEPWIKYKFRITYKTENGSGMVIVKAYNEHRARYEFVAKHGLPYGAIQKIDKVE